MNFNSERYWISQEPTLVCKLCKKMVCGNTTMDIDVTNHTLQEYYENVVCCTEERCKE